MRELGRRLLKQENLPRFEPVDLTLAMLLEEGEASCCCRCACCCACCCCCCCCCACCCCCCCACCCRCCRCCCCNPGGLWRQGQVNLPPAGPIDLISPMLLEGGKGWLPQQRLVQEQEMANSTLAAVHPHHTAPDVPTPIAPQAAGWRRSRRWQAALWPSHFSPLLTRPPLLLIAGRRLVQEQEMVNSMRLSDEYLKKQRKMVGGWSTVAGSCSLSWCTRLCCLQCC